MFYSVFYVVLTILGGSSQIGHGEIINSEVIMADQFRSNFKSGAARSITPETLGHTWHTVVNPVSQNRVLQACDHCGVVKSENSIVRVCRGHRETRLLSAQATGKFQQAV